MSQMMQSNFFYDWSQKALDLQLGEELFIQAETRDEMKTMYAGFVKELQILKQVNVGASSLIVGKLFRDARHWVYIRRVAVNPHIGFIKRKDGSIERVSVVEGEKERFRRIELMIAEGIELEDIEAVEGELSPAERAKFGIGEH